MLAEAQEQLLARDDAIRSLRGEEFAQLEDVIARQGEAIRWLEDLLAQRDGEIQWLRGVVSERERETSWLREAADRQAARLRECEQSLHTLQATRVWRLALRYWRLRDRVLRRSRAPR